MANNRMSLKCRGCGKTFLLGKVGSVEYQVYHEDLKGGLNKFYYDHAFCSEVQEVHNENQFELEYETCHDDEDEKLESKNCSKCIHFVKHPTYKNEGFCLAQDGRIGGHSYLNNAEKETKCILFQRGD